jgi:hypothetical protein
VPFALERTQEFLQSGEFNDVDSPCLIKNKHLHIEDEDYVKKANTIYHCDLCCQDIHSEKNYIEHLKGKRHMKQVLRKRKIEENELSSDDNEKRHRVDTVEKE